jgi:D-alanine-D-alanine ligase
MKVAVLHNLKPDQVLPAQPDDAYEEYDAPETIAAICGALAEIAIRPVPLIADRDLPGRLADGAFDFAFNIAEGSGRRCREAVAAALCELIELPYTGSDALTLAAAQDKAMARRIVGHDVPVARGHLVTFDEVDLAALEQLRFPVMVKPNDEGSSKGIGTGSICHSLDATMARCRWLAATYGAPALVEEFLAGPEVTIGLRGNGRDRHVLGIMEIAPVDGLAADFVYDVATKRDWRRRVCYHVPARLPADTLALLESQALTVADRLGCRDLARIDFRLDRDGLPHFIECNPLPGLDPDYGDIVILSRDRVPYAELVQGIIRDAAKRQGIAMR